VQVYGGFDQGRWQSEADRQWYDSTKAATLLDKESVKTTGLRDNHADAALAVRSFESIIVTNENNTKMGPLRLAAEQGGRVLYLGNVKKYGLSVKDDLDRFLQALNRTDKKQSWKISDAENNILIVDRF
jgi:hypothetical protein